MATHQILQVVALVLLVLAALASWTWRPGWDHSYGHALGWAGLAFYVLAGLTG
jgi:hypothetical protein